MKTIKRGLIAITLLFSSPVIAEQDLYLNLTILDPDTQTKKENQYILINEGHIAAIGTGNPSKLYAKATLHNMQGAFAMPGLIDSHAHPTLGPINYSRDENGKIKFAVLRNDDVARHNALMLLAHGITTIRDPGADTNTIVDFRSKLKEGKIIGPETIGAGLILDSSPYPMAGLNADRTTASIPEIIKGQADAGMEYIKLYTSLSPEELKEGINAAHANGLRAVAHLSDVSWTDAANMGIDSLVHMFPNSAELLPQENRKAYLESRRPGIFQFFEWYEHADLDAPEIKQMIDTLAQKGVHFDATLIAFYLGFWGNDLTIRDRYNDLSHPVNLENWLKSFRFDLGWKPSDYDRAKAVWPQILRLTKMMYDGGVPMTLGTDQNNPFVIPGVSLYQEMMLHADAGIPNWGILRMATTQAARIMGLDHKTGQIRVGLEADFVILDKNPSIDMGNIQTIKAVINNGQYYVKQDLINSAKHHNKTIK